MKRENREYTDREKKVVAFNASTLEIIRNITAQTTLEGVDVATEVQDPSFRFMSLSTGELVYSTELSEAFATVAKLIKTRDTRPAIDKSTTKRIANADKFTMKTYPLIEQMHADAGIITNKEIVERLNREQVPTYKGGNWHLSTLNNMKKRWNKLNIKTLSAIS